MKPRDPIVKAFQNNKGVRVQNSNSYGRGKARQASPAEEGQARKNFYTAAKVAATAASVLPAGKVAATGAKIVGKVVAKKASESAAKDVAKKAVSAKYPTSNVKKLPSWESQVPKINYYNAESRRRAFDSINRQSYKEEGTYAGKDYVNQMWERNYKNKINNIVRVNSKRELGSSAPEVTPKAVRQQDAIRNKIIKNNKKKGK